MLEFDQFSQRYSIPCTVRPLADSDPAWQATFWHNSLFNPNIPGDVQILAFTPDRSAAAANPPADAAHDVEGPSMVTAMAFNCRNFAIRVSGLGDEWFIGPHATVQAKLFEGHNEDEIA